MDQIKDFFDRNLGLNSLKQVFEANKIIIIGFITLLIAIPSGSYVISWRIKASSPNQLPQNYDRTVTLGSSPAPNSGLDKKSQGLLNQALNEVNQGDAAGSASNSASTKDEGEAKLFLGPSLEFKLNLEGRPADKQQTELFVGIADGSKVSDKPTYLLQFTVDLPKNGIFSGLSLAGLSQGSTYTAYLKAPAQIATSSAFTVGSAVSKLNAGNTLYLITGDLNEDNIINSADYSIAKGAFGSVEGDTNWNVNVDFNLDGIINGFDIAILVKNLGRTGLSGSWYSPNPSASGSANLKTVPAVGAIGSKEEEDSPLSPPKNGGYWIWVPEDNN